MHEIENQLLAFLLREAFPTKKAMACALAIPYRMLLRVCAGQGSPSDSRQVTSHIIRYCVQNRIPLEEALDA